VLSKGQITIPVGVARKLGLRRGDRVAITTDAEGNLIGTLLRPRGAGPPHPETAPARKRQKEVRPR
jgi:AbrB family looped-hinge helix DNA binding protein